MLFDRTPHRSWIAVATSPGYDPAKVAFFECRMPDPKRTALLLTRINPLVSTLYVAHYARHVIAKHTHH